MPSTVAWLDSSAEEQRRVREVLSLFSQAESRDELGIGQIRDAFSDLLFPGTSVLLTRARYFLVVPWLYRLGATRRSGRELWAWVEKHERRLIEPMKLAGHVEGLIGRVAGPRVKLLPSTIYWTGLQRYGILRDQATPDRLGLRAPNLDAEADELAERPVTDWPGTLPPAPEGFPGDLDGGFALTAVEAEWLSERIRTSAPGTLLAHILAGDLPVDPRSSFPWDDPTTHDAPPEIGETLHHAELFSLSMHGAALLYNLLVGEAYERAGHTRIEAPVEAFRDELTNWADDCRSAATKLTTWDRNQFWNVVRGHNPRIAVTTTAFVNRWLDAVVGGAGTAAADDDDLRGLVRARELQQKRAQARLSNAGLLASWSGASGTGRLDYRWGTVRRLVADIQEGQARANA